MKICLICANKTFHPLNGTFTCTKTKQDVDFTKSGCPEVTPLYCNNNPS